MERHDEREAWRKKKIRRDGEKARGGKYREERKDGRKGKDG